MSYKPEGIDMSFVASLNDYPYGPNIVSLKDGGFMYSFYSDLRSWFLRFWHATI